MRRLARWAVLVLVLSLMGCSKTAIEESVRTEMTTETINTDKLKTETVRSEEPSEGHTTGERMVKTVDGIEYAFRWCPAGKFVMGSPKDEEYRDGSEIQHEVTLTQGFWMLETEVTQRMWQSVMEESISDKAKQGTFLHTLDGEGPDYPMYYVSWNDCQAFCEKLTRKIGLKITLPTEAQWEYACRAGTTGPYAGELDELGWYSVNSGTSPVGQKQPNAWGLYDMYGNVWEWCQDRHGKYPAGAVSDPTGPNSGSGHIIRGGSWCERARFCRSAARNGGGADYRDGDLGFRVVICPHK